MGHGHRRAAVADVEQQRAHRLGARSAAAHVRRSVDAVHRGVGGGGSSAALSYVRCASIAAHKTRKMQVARRAA
jgi:hypothetical protein